MSVNKSMGLVGRLVGWVVFFGAFVVLGAAALTLLGLDLHWSSFGDKAWSLAVVAGGLTAICGSLFSLMLSFCWVFDPPMVDL